MFNQDVLFQTNDGHLHDGIRTFHWTLSRSSIYFIEYLLGQLSGGYSAAPKYIARFLSSKIGLELPSDRRVGPIRCNDRIRFVRELFSAVYVFCKHTKKIFIAFFDSENIPPSLEDAFAFARIYRRWIRNVRTREKIEVSPQPVVCCVPGSHSVIQWYLLLRVQVQIEYIECIIRNSEWNLF